MQKFGDYRIIDEEEKETQTSKKLGELPLHEKLSRFDLVDFLRDFDATSLYPSAMWDENSI